MEENVWALQPCYLHHLPSLPSHPSLAPSITAVGTYGSQSATRFCIQVQNVNLSSDILQANNRYKVVPLLHHSMKHANSHSICTLHV